MGRKLTAEEIDFLFSACFFMDSISKDNFFRSEERRVGKECL